ncbi:phospholipase D-like domain-containing protein [Candidatus Halobonum tyrrellensis]|uniref:Phospholipase D-like domain-containing protein n=1 Tax=Candidatus Halobonum tyrrellensis G22 TaxID=1324957 RepID=V4GNB6_9EURY|nr:phospholipase D-like domain-containing protein [Candidatus Halobonum tyrrellensis]ESP86871.1 hypothetical protein K933_17347 [Candidatus Halobonum tyrrellensis G22]
MTDLLYWPGDELNGTDRSRSESPFWNATTELTNQTEALRIVCPYLAPRYIKKITEDACDWQLVTDLQAWTRVYGSTKETEIMEFVHTHSAQIRHYPGVHAKAVIGDSTAVFGSANLTRNGMTERQELGIRLRDRNAITDLHEWFDALWDRGSKIDPETASRDVFPPEEHTAVPDSFGRLQRAPSREWAESVLDLLATAIDTVALGEDDPRLVTSAAQDNRLVVTVNSRYVCGGFFDGTPRVGFILADDVGGVDEAREHELSTKYYRFSTRDGRNPHWVVFDQLPDDPLLQMIEPAWTTAIERELERGTQSQYRRYHNDRVYRLVVDDAYRNAMLDELFA